MINKICEKCKIKYKNCRCYLQYSKIKDGLSHFLSAPELARQTSFKKKGHWVKIIDWRWDIINGRKTNTNRICHTIQRYAKANNKCMKKYDKTAKSSYLIYLDANNL